MSEIISDKLCRFFVSLKLSISSALSHIVYKEWNNIFSRLRWISDRTDLRWRQRILPVSDLLPAWHEQSLVNPLLRKCMSLMPIAALKVVGTSVPVAPDDQNFFSSYVNFGRKGKERKIYSSLAASKADRME